MAKPITDEQLNDIERQWRNHAGGPGPIGATVLQLVAELRAARTWIGQLQGSRVELRAEIQIWQARCSADQDNMTRFRRRAIAAEAERDKLQRRVEGALAECDNLERIIEHLTSDSEARATAAGASVAVVAIRTALLGQPTQAPESTEPKPACHLVMNRGDGIEIIHPGDCGENPEQTCGLTQAPGSLEAVIASLTQGQRVRVVWEGVVDVSHVYPGDRGLVRDPVALVSESNDSDRLVLRYTGQSPGWPDATALKVAGQHNSGVVSIEVADGE